MKRAKEMQCRGLVVALRMFAGVVREAAMARATLCMQVDATRQLFLNKAGKTMLHQTLKLSLVPAGVLALCAGMAHAEQTIGIQNPGGAAAIATARVNVRVMVPKIVILRVGSADATISNVDFTVGLSPEVAGAPGESLAYAGPIAPTLSTSVASSNPSTNLGVLATGAWTNVAGGATLTCALSSLSGSTAFASGATAGGVPGTDDIKVEGTTPAHPGASLTQCDGASNSPIVALTPLSGTFTYSSTFNATSIASGNYGATVTYTATTL